MVIFLVCSFCGACRGSRIFDVSNTQIHFYQVKTWEKHDALNNLVLDIEQRFCQPQSVKVCQNAHQGTQDQIAEIVLDSGSHGIEWAMFYTIPKFMEHIFGPREIPQTNTGDTMLFVYFAQCMQGRAQTHRLIVVTQHANGGSAETFAKWKKRRHN